MNVTGEVCFARLVQNHERQLFQSNDRSGYVRETDRVCGALSRGQRKRVPKHLPEYLFGVSYIRVTR